MSAVDGKWEVERHGGMTRGSGGKWRQIAAGTEAECREVYENVQRDLRQGAVRIFNSSGEVIRQRSAPRLRSRW